MTLALFLFTITPQIIFRQDTLPSYPVPAGWIIVDTTASANNYYLKTPASGFLNVFTGSTVDWTSEVGGKPGCFTACVHLHNINDSILSVLQDSLPEYITSARLDSFMDLFGVNLTVARCSTYGKVTLVHDTVYYGVLTSRSPARFFLGGEAGDTAMVIARDSSGIIIIRAWLSRSGVWHNVHGDSAFYGEGSPGGGISADECSDSCDNVRDDIRDTVSQINIEWEKIVNEPSTYPPEAHNQNISTVNYLLDSLSIKSPTGHSHNGLAPSGGASSYVLKKNSASDYDYSWAVDATGGGGAGANPGQAAQLWTMDPWDAVTKYVAGTANRGYWQPLFLPCSLIVTKFMFRGRLQRGSDFGVYDSSGTRLWSTGVVKPNPILTALCSLTVTPNLRLGPGQYYIAWACSSASYDTLYGVAQPVAGMIRRSGYKATSCPLPASVDLNALTLDVRRLWFNLRRY